MRRSVSGTSHDAENATSVRRPRILGVDVPVRQSVESHGGAARSDHRHDDPPDRTPSRPAIGRQHHAEERERQGEEGVLELDHFEHRSELAEV